MGHAPPRDDRNSEVRYGPRFLSLFSSFSGISMATYGFVANEPELAIAGIAMMAAPLGWPDDTDDDDAVVIGNTTFRQPEKDDLTLAWEDIDGPALVAQMMSTNNVIDRLELEDEIDYRLNIKERPPEPEPDWAAMKEGIERKARSLFRVPAHHMGPTPKNPDVTLIEQTVEEKKKRLWEKVIEMEPTSRRVEFQKMRHKANARFGKQPCDCGACNQQKIEFYQARSKYDAGSDRCECECDSCETGIHHPFETENLGTGARTPGCLKPPCHDCGAVGNKHNLGCIAY